MDNMCGYITAKYQQVGRNDDKSDFQEKLQRFVDDGNIRDEYVQLFRNQVKIRRVEEIWWFNAGSCVGAGKDEGSIVSPARGEALIATLNRCLREQDARKCQRQKLYAETQGKKLQLAMKQMIGNVRVLLQHELGGKVMYTQDREMNHLAEVPLSSEI